MRLSRSVRWLLLALLVSLIPASSYAGVFISVAVAPPPLVVYDQPPCPQPGLMWTPGYWAYGPDGYYWVPGAWVPAPYVGALWTPGYWGWSGGMYIWHPGYWGPHVGYYGGVNYGFGFFGVGFVGGVWHGGVFAYNTAVVHVNSVVVRNVYVDRTVIVNHTVVNNRVAYAGGPGGINHMPTPEERAAMREPHMMATSFQAQHEMQARSDRAAYFNNNHGRPAVAAAPRPLAAENHPAPMARPNGMNNQMRPMNNSYRPNEMQSRPAPEMRPENRPMPQERPQPRPQERQAPRPEPRSESRDGGDHRR
jgi:hypothetical protein